MGRSQCGPVLPSAQPPPLRALWEEAVHAGGGCRYRFPGRHARARAVWLETGHLPVGSPLELGGDLLRAKHVFLRQGRRSARSRAGFPLLSPARAEPTRTLGLGMGCSSDLRGAASRSPASLSLSGSSLGWDLPPWTAVCLAALLDFPHIFSISLVPREGELHGSQSCLVHARPQSAAQCLAQEGHSRI